MGGLRENPARLEGLAQTIHGTYHTHEAEAYIETQYPDRLTGAATALIGTAIAELNDTIGTLSSQDSKTEQKLSSIFTARRNSLAGLIATSHAYIAEQVVEDEVRQGIPGKNSMIAEDLKQEVLLEIWKVACNHDPRINERRKKPSDFLVRAWTRARYVAQGALAHELGLERGELEHLESYVKARHEAHAPASEVSVIEKLAGFDEDAPFPSAAYEHFDRGLFWQLVRLIHRLPVVQYGLHTQPVSQQEVLKQVNDKFKEEDLVRELHELLHNGEAAQLTPALHKAFRDQYRLAGGTLPPHSSDQEQYRKRDDTRALRKVRSYLRSVSDK